MMYKTKNDDVYNDLTGKRAALVINKHAVGRGGEFGQLNVKKFTFNPFLDCLDTSWKEMKTLTLHACPFVAKKDLLRMCTMLLVAILLVGMCSTEVVTVRITRISSFVQ